MSGGFQRQLSRPLTNVGASPTRFLQRCSCGLRSAGPTECTSCKEKKRWLSRRAKADNFDFDAPLQTRVTNVLRLPGQPLDAETRTVMESRFGRDFSRVRVHTDMAAAETAVQLNAEAYTVGRHIVFAPGRYSPSVPDGRRLLAHELTHVLQQDGVADAAGAEIAVGPVDDAFEREAERVADAVLAEPDGLTPVVPAPSLSVSAPAIQRKACGPKVDKQVTDVWNRIEAEFRGWSDDAAADACSYLVNPRVVKTDEKPRKHDVDWTDPLGGKHHLGTYYTQQRTWNTEAFDTLPLFYGGAMAWLINDSLQAKGCCVPSIVHADAQSMWDNQGTCEAKDSCCSTVQIDGKCWLSGTVNYGTFGVMVRLCGQRFPIRFVGIKQTARDLAVVYKKYGHMNWFGGKTTEEPDFHEPLSWYDATVNGGPSARPSRAGNKPDCPLTCPLDGSIQPVWDYVWEPVKRRPSDTAQYYPPVKYKVYTADWPDTPKIP